jgi:hypothetical protein
VFMCFVLVPSFKRKRLLSYSCMFSCLTVCPPCIYMESCASWHVSLYPYDRERWREFKCRLYDLFDAYFD